MQHTQEAARSIAADAGAGAALTAHAEDAVAKCALLHRELAFNEALADALETLQIAAGLLDTAQEAAVDGELRVAVEKMAAGEKVLEGLRGCEGTRFGGLMDRRRVLVKSRVVEAVRACWSQLVVVDADARKITVNSHDGGVSTYCYDLLLTLP
jgi:protein transport protein DSL1/ZW10